MTAQQLIDELTDKAAQAGRSLSDLAVTVLTWDGNPQEEVDVHHVHIRVGAAVLS